MDRPPVRPSGPPRGGAGAAPALPAPLWGGPAPSWGLGRGLGPASQLRRGRAVWMLCKGPQRRIAQLPRSGRPISGFLPLKPSASAAAFPPFRGCQRAPAPGGGSRDPEGAGLRGCGPAGARLSLRWGSGRTTLAAPRPVQSARPASPASRTARGTRDGGWTGGGRKNFLLTGFEPVCLCCFAFACMLVYLRGAAQIKRWI